MLSISQTTAVERCYEEDYTLLIAAKGTGKTRIGLCAAHEMVRDGHLNRVLVLCPNKVRHGWIDEAERCYVPGVVLVEGDAAERAAILAGEGTIFIMGVDLLPWLRSEYRWLPADGLILDETTRFSKPGAVGVKTLRKFHKKIKWVVGLTASPVMEDPMALYGQALVIDGGECLGTSFDRFKNTYFFATDYMQYNWELQFDAMPRLAGAVAPLLHMVDDPNYEDSLPSLREKGVPLVAPDSFWHDYGQMAEGLLLNDDGTEIEAPNMAVVSGKLEQMAQGFIYDEVGEVRRWFHTIKFDRLVELVDELARPVVIVYAFNAERDELFRRFPTARDLSEKDGKSAFLRGETQILTMHIRSGSHGVDGLQYRCHTMICTKPFWSADGWDQVAGRLRRRGQEHVVTRYTLMLHGSIDDVILDRAETKADTGASLLTHMKARASV